MAGGPGDMRKGATSSGEIQPLAAGHVPLLPQASPVPHSPLSQNIYLGKFKINILHFGVLDHLEP